MTDDITNITGSRVSMALRGAVTLIECFNENRGLMDEAMEAELLQALDRLERWPQCRVVVITGRDAGVFIRHYDVAVLHDRARTMVERKKTFHLDRPVPKSSIHRILERIAESPRLFIAAVNGTAMGGGFELALGCDLRIVEAGDHEIGLPEANIGLLPGAGGTRRLVELIGESRAMQVLLAKPLFAPEALVDLGIASACVPDARAHAMAMAAALLDIPARAIANIKLLVRGHARWQPEASAAAERTLFCDCMVDPESLHLMRKVGLEGASIAKRQPGTATVERT